MLARAESSGIGRLLISAFVVVSVVLAFVVNMPASTVRSKIVGATHPYINALGLDGGWAVFAPDFRHQTLELEARVTYADGSQVIWHRPVGGDVFGAYWDYRWQKWMERVTSPDYRDALWAPAADYIARQEARPGTRVAAVTLIRRTFGLEAPSATGPARTPWRQSAYYTRTYTAGHGPAHASAPPPAGTAQAGGTS